jgi:hypothetical protein
MLPVSGPKVCGGGGGGGWVCKPISVLSLEQAEQKKISNCLGNDLRNNLVFW